MVLTDLNPLDWDLGNVPPGIAWGGVDEAGRGAWAGPVVAACAVLDPQAVHRWSHILRTAKDSKKLSPEKRESIAAELKMVLTAWAVGLGAVAMLCAKVMSPHTARYDAERRRLVITGSWLPLIVILAIFSVRYAMGVAKGMDLAFVRDRNVQLAVSLLLGTFSGFFLARGFVFWRTYATHHLRPDKRPIADLHGE